MNVAFIFRGHWREWNNSKYGFLHSLGKLSQECNLVVFIATWEKSNYGIQVSSDGYEYSTEDEEFDLDSVMGDLTSIGLVIGGVKVLDEKKARETITVRDQENYELISFLRTIGNSLKIQYEVENDLIFDLVIETRSDLFFVIEDTKKALSRVHDFKVDAQCFFPKSKTVPITERQSMIDFVGDLHFRMSSPTSDVLNTLFHSLYSPGQPIIKLPVHHLMGYTAGKYGLELYQSGPLGILEILRPVIGDVDIDFTDLTEETRIKVERNRKAFDFLRNNPNLIKRYLRIRKNE